MSSPIHHDDNTDPILRYAPPHAREQGRAPADASNSNPEQTSPTPPIESAETSGDRAIIEMRKRLALDPNWVPEPPHDPAPPRDLWPLALQTSIALAAAAVVAWVVTALPAAIQHGRNGAAPPSAAAPIWSTSRSTVPPSGTMPPVSVRSVATLSIAAKPQAQPLRAAAEPPVPETNERSDPAPRTPTPPSAELANARTPANAEMAPAERVRPEATVEPGATQRRAAPDFVTRQVDGEELAAMRRRAGDFIKSGDLSSARLLLRRAAEAGSEEAALTLAGTFDPNVLAARGVQDGAADIALARLWYERAAQFGSSEAPRRLRQLANNSLQ